MRKAAKPCSYQAGSAICRQGMPGDGVFLIEQGTVRICFEPVAEDLHELYHLGPGELFGEMAVLDNLPRSATVLAESDVNAMFIAREDLMRLFEEHPRVAVGVLRQIANRFRDFSRQHIEQISRDETTLAPERRQARSIPAAQSVPGGNPGQHADIALPRSQ